MKTIVCDAKVSFVRHDLPFVLRKPVVGRCLQNGSEVESQLLSYRIWIQTERQTCHVLAMDASRAELSSSRPARMNYVLA